jgi:hypothetical protein
VPKYYSPDNPYVYVFPTIPTALPTDDLIAELTTQGLLTPAQAAALATHERSRPFSVHYELRALLYLGITLLTGGLGVLVYQNIEHIGHGVVVAFIALVMLACFTYAARHRPPFSWAESPRAGVLPDYLLLLGCLTFLILEGYLQYQYNVFGTRYGLVTVLPAALFLGLAYAFDHRGVLSMGLTALASWVGVSIAPLSAFTDNNFWHSGLGSVAILLGLLLMGLGLLSEYRQLKPHFAFTYLSLGSNLALIAATVALLSEAELALPPRLLVLLILLMSGFLVWYARRTHSYLFLLMGVIYAYIVATYLFFRVLSLFSGESSLLVLLYFPLSTLGAVLLFLNFKKILRIDGK